MRTAMPRTGAARRPGPAARCCMPGRRARPVGAVQSLLEVVPGIADRREALEVAARGDAARLVDRDHDVPKSGVRVQRDLVAVLSEVERRRDPTVARSRTATRIANLPEVNSDHPTSYAGSGRETVIERADRERQVARRRVPQPGPLVTVDRPEVHRELEAGHLAQRRNRSSRIRPVRKIAERRALWNTRSPYKLQWFQVARMFRYYRNTSTDGTAHPTTHRTRTKDQRRTDTARVASPLWTVETMPPADGVGRSGRGGREGAMRSSRLITRRGPSPSRLVRSSIRRMYRDSRHTCGREVHVPTPASWWPATCLRAHGTRWPRPNFPTWTGRATSGSCSALQGSLSSHRERTATRSARRTGQRTASRANRPRRSRGPSSTAAHPMEDARSRRRGAHFSGLDGADCRFPGPRGPDHTRKRIDRRTSTGPGFWTDGRETTISSGVEGSFLFLPRGGWTP